MVIGKELGGPVFAAPLGNEVPIIVYLISKKFYAQYMIVKVQSKQDSIHAIQLYKAERGAPSLWLENPRRLKGYPYYQNKHIIRTCPTYGLQ
jgi:hypothetical protein